MTERQKVFGLILILVVLFVGIKWLQKSNQETEIDMRIISSIESNHNHKAISPKGARGQYQIMRPTWNECAKLMKVDWDYDTEWKNPEKNRQIGEFYMHKRIPQMLRAYGVPVTIETKLACYNGGIGRVKNAWRTGGQQNWKLYLPQETQKYIIKYRSI